MTISAVITDKSTENPDGNREWDTREKMTSVPPTSILINVSYTHPTEKFVNDYATYRFPSKKNEPFTIEEKNEDESERYSTLIKRHFTENKTQSNLALSRRKSETITGAISMETEVYVSTPMVNVKENSDATKVQSLKKVFSSVKNLTAGPYSTISYKALFSQYPPTSVMKRTIKELMNSYPLLRTTHLNADSLQQEPVTELFPTTERWPFSQSIKGRERNETISTPIKQITSADTNISPASETYMQEVSQSNIPDTTASNRKTESGTLESD